MSVVDGLGAEVEVEESTIATVFAEVERSAKTDLPFFVDHSVSMRKLSHHLALILIAIGKPDSIPQTLVKLFIIFPHELKLMAGLFGDFGWGYTCEIREVVDGLVVSG